MTRVAVVTGGSRGIGFAIARALSDSGLSVALTARDVDRAERCAREIGGSVLGLGMDVRDSVAVDAALRRVVEHFGRIDILINNAGRGGGGRSIDLPEEEWRDILDTNLQGVIRTTHAALALGGMLERAWGRVINIASTGGKQGVVFAAAYSASKHGVVGYTKSLGLELAKTGVTVNAVCPGFVETDLAVQARANYARLWRVSPDEAKERIEARIPLGRYVQPEEVASMVAHLVSEGAAAITGQAINVCGGLGNY